MPASLLRERNKMASVMDTARYESAGSGAEPGLGPVLRGHMAALEGGGQDEGRGVRQPAVSVSEKSTTRPPVIRASCSRLVGTPVASVPAAG